MKIDWDLFSEILGGKDSAFIHDLDKIDSFISQLKSSFPSSSLHTFAVKSNPVMDILKFFVHRGMGLECASLEEVWLAIEAGCPMELILHDGPAKTNEELEYCLLNGIGVIANDEIDLARIKEILNSNSDNYENRKKSRIGIRINPVSGYGRIRETSVSTLDSKFGIVTDSNFSLESILSEFPFLNGVHVHIGSQGISLSQLTLGIEKVLKLIHNIPKDHLNSIEWVDIGGGISVDYSNSELAFSFSDVSESFSWFFSEHPKIQIITEYGRALVSTSAFFVSKAEKVFEREGVQNIIIHGGADAFLRWVYSPDNWWHKISLEHEKGSDIIPTQIHGPLCFSGDRLGREENMPRISEGSLVAIHDAGAYVISMWSKHCNRRRPSVVGISRGKPPIEMFSGDNKKDIINHW